MSVSWKPGVEGPGGVDNGCAAEHPQQRARILQNGVSSFNSSGGWFVQCADMGGNKRMPILVRSYVARWLIEFDVRIYRCRIMAAKRAYYAAP